MDVINGNDLDDENVGYQVASVRRGGRRGEERAENIKLLAQGMRCVLVTKNGGGNTLKEVKMNQIVVQIDEDFLINHFHCHNGANKTLVAPTVNMNFFTGRENVVCSQGIRERKAC